MSSEDEVGTSSPPRPGYRSLFPRGADSCLQGVWNQPKVNCKVKACFLESDGTAGWYLGTVKGRYKSGAGVFSDLLKAAKAGAAECGQLDDKWAAPATSLPQWGITVEFEDEEGFYIYPYPDNRGELVLFGKNGEELDTLRLDGGTKAYSHDGADADDADVDDADVDALSDDDDGPAAAAAASKAADEAASAAAAEASAAAAAPAATRSSSRQAKPAPTSSSRQAKKQPAPTSSSKKKAPAATSSRSAKAKKAVQGCPFLAALLDSLALSALEPQFTAEEVTYEDLVDAYRASRQELSHLLAEVGVKAKNRVAICTAVADAVADDKDTEDEDDEAATAPPPTKKRRAAAPAPPPSSSSSAAAAAAPSSSSSSAAAAAAAPASSATAPPPAKKKRSGPPYIHRQAKDKKIFVVKKNSVEQNKAVLEKKVKAGAVSIDYALMCMGYGGPLRGYWAASRDDMHEHIDELCAFLESWRARLV